MIIVHPNEISFEVHQRTPNFYLPEKKMVVTIVIKKDIEGLAYKVWIT
jgi:hypothetical protein